MRRTLAALRVPTISHRSTFLLALLLVILFPLASDVSAAAGTTQRVSLDSSGNQGASSSYNPEVSADGRYVVFASDSPFVATDSNNRSDVFVRDRQTSVTEMISVSTSGTAGNSGSGDGGMGISQDGRYVAFASNATNLAIGDGNGRSDVFVRDRTLAQTEMVSVDSIGIQGNSISERSTISRDGRYVAFASDAGNLVGNDNNATRDIFVHDRMNGTTERVSVSSTEAEANGYSHEGAISGNGRYVVFESDASNLVPGDGNGVRDIFLRDLVAGTTELVNLDSSEIQGNSAGVQARISADGRYVVFVSVATNLVPNDTNGFPDVFIRDRKTGTTELVSVSTAGIQANNTPCFQGNRCTGVSDDGRWVVLVSEASNLVSGDTNGFADVFVRDRLGSTTQLASMDSNGIQGNHIADQAAIAGNGGLLTFASHANNLVGDDTNGVDDIFVRDVVPEPVGGIAQLPDVDAALGAQNSSGPSAGLLAAVALGGTAVVALGGAAWYARRR